MSTGYWMEQVGDGQYGTLVVVDRRSRWYVLEVGSGLDR